ncbi:hypothetical protein AMJ80_11590, partial [bacterium SM23_31]
PEYDHPAAATVHVADVVTRTMTFPKGSFVIQTGQVMGRVVAHLLEPETNDNVVKWNTMDYALPLPESRVGGRVRELPIYKLMKPTPLPTKVLN